MGAAAGGLHTVLVLEDGTVRAFGEPDLEPDLPDLAGVKVVEASAGFGHAVLLFEDGTVQAFGDNVYGETDIPDLAGVKVVQTSAADGYTVLVLEDGTARIFGKHCGRVRRAGYKVVHASAGLANVVFITDCGETMVNGQIAGGKIAGGKLRPLACDQIVYASAGGQHMALVLKDGTVRVIGDNQEGQTDVPELSMACVPPPEARLRAKLRTWVTASLIARHGGLGAVERMVAAMSGEAGLRRELAAVVVCDEGF